MILLDSTTEECLSISERKEYYQKLRDNCFLMQDSQLQIGQDLIKYIYPFFRKYKLEIQGEENIPKDSNVVFSINHSNSHDFFTASETLSFLNRRGSIMASTDCLNSIVKTIFNISNATLLDRRIKEERYKSVFLMSKKILGGKDGVIFGEGTWNLHPILPMHNIRTGAVIVATITQVPIIPTIFEYIENDGFIKKEIDLISKCIIRFGKPIMPNYNFSLITQSNNIKEVMATNRIQVWKDYSINRESIDDIDPFIYVNNTHLKKFALGYDHDSEEELNHLLFLPGDKKENEYTIDYDGEFKPGVTQKNSSLIKKLRI